MPDSSHEARQKIQSSAIDRRRVRQFDCRSDDLHTCLVRVEEQESPNGTARWTAVVTEAMKARGLTQAGLADRLGIKERTVRAMFSGAIGVTPERLNTIAEILDLDAIELFRLHNWVAAERAAATDTGTAARDAVELLNDSALAPRSGAALLVERALELGGYRAHVHSSLLPTPIAGHTRDRDYVGVAVADRPSGDRRTGRLPDDELERELRAAFAVAIRLGPALLEDSPDNLATLERLWPDADAWFWVPKLMASRPPRAPAPLPGGVETVVVVGDHGAGASHIGAYLADRAGWGYVGTSFDAQRAFGRAPDNQAAHDQHCLDIADAYLSSDHGRYRVIAHGSRSTVDSLIRRAADTDAGRNGRPRRRTAVVYARANDTLVEYGSRVWGNRMDAVVPGVSADYRVRNDRAIATARPGCAVEEFAHVAAIDMPADVLVDRGCRQPEIDRWPFQEAAAERIWAALAAGRPAR